MSRLARLFYGITLLTLPTIAYGGFFLLSVLSHWDKNNFTPFQQSMFRAGHAHAGVLVILSLVAQVLIDHSALSKSLNLCLRISFPLAAILISSGFFASAIGKDLTEPNQNIAVLYSGIGVLVFAVITLGIGLLRRSRAPQNV